MRKITLVFSGHRENGLCNVDELLKFLRTIEPEVVFEEIRPEDFDAFYKNGIYSTLEVQAIKRYREVKSLQQVPVDRYDMPSNLVIESKRGVDRVLDCVAEKSQDYEPLNEEHYKNAHRDGLKYLNSADCAARMARIQEVEDTTILGTRDQVLIRGLEQWRRNLQMRERKMIGNIYEYCRKNEFETGVFLVGAGHSIGIVKAIKEYANAEPLLVTWSLAYGDQIT